MDYNFYFNVKDLRNNKQNINKIDNHMKNLYRYISVNKIQKGLKIKITPQTPGFKTNNFLPTLGYICIWMFNATFETSFRRCLIPKEGPRKIIFGFAQNQWKTTLDRRIYKHMPSSRWNSKIRRHQVLTVWNQTQNSNWFHRGHSGEEDAYTTFQKENESRE